MKLNPVFLLIPRRIFVLLVNRFNNKYHHYE